MDKPVKRREGPHLAVLNAAFGLLATVPYAQITMELLARTAKVGKPTLYRWWKSKADIFLEAATSDAQSSLPTPNTGTLPGDWRAYWTSLFEILNRGGAVVARSLLSEVCLDPLFAADFRDSFVKSRRIELENVLARYSQFDHGSPSKQQIFLDSQFGTLWYRILLHEPLDENLIEWLVAQLPR